MDKKLIAVTPLWDGEKGCIWMRSTYMEALRECGAIPVVLPLQVEPEDAFQILDKCDALLLTGGPDIAPERFGEAKKPTCGTVCEARDRLEEAVYYRALEKNMPILGICRGVQMINVFQGGTLYQDLPTETVSDLHHSGEEPYDQIHHYVNLEGMLRELLGACRIGVNSMHHQAVKDVGEGLEVLARADDGVVEAVRHKEKAFVWGVQWHPEWNFHASAYSPKIIKAFVEACG